jgi:RTX calcium-binding nonapeptide repeat (4 copies)
MDGLMAGRGSFHAPSAFRVGVLIAPVCDFLTLLAPGAGAIAKSCGGRTATIVGTPGDDLLIGKRSSDVIYGGGGDDYIDGGDGGEPLLEGGPGSDTVLEGTGIDHADGGPGDRDIFRGDSGIDHLSGGEGAQDIVSYASATRQGVVVDLETGHAKGDGHDVLSEFEDVVGSPQDDQLKGDPGSNRLDGGVGDDDLDGGVGSDEAFGGAGSDECERFSVEHSCGVETETRGQGAFATLNQGLGGISFVVQGEPGPDSVGDRVRQRKLDGHRSRCGARRRRVRRDRGQRRQLPVAGRDRTARHHRRWR